MGLSLEGGLFHRAGNSSSPVGLAAKPTQVDRRVDDQQDIRELAIPTRGHDQALASLYLRHGAHLRRLVCRIVGEIESHDIVQEVFVYAWQHAGLYDPARGDVGGWLASMARSRAIDLVRARQAIKRQPLVDATTAVATVPESVPPNYAMLRAAISLLSDRQRRLVDLAFYEGLGHSEIAKTTGLPLGTVKTWLRTAVQNLRLAVPRTSFEALLSGAGRPPILRWLEGRILGEFADLYFVDRLTASGHVQRVDWGHVNPSVREEFDQIWRFVPPTSAESHPVRRVLLSARQEFVLDASPSWPSRVATSAQHLRFLQRLRVRSVISEPILCDGQLLGAVTVARVDPSTRAYGHADLQQMSVIAKVVGNSLGGSTPCEI